MRIKKYVKPKTLQEAYELLKKGKKNQLLAGCTFLRITDTFIDTGIDIMALGLDYIDKSADFIRIGATTPLRKIELDRNIAAAADGAFAEILGHLIGIQLRNSITIGAHVYSRYGFSDIITLLLALDASVKLYSAGERRLEDFLKDPGERDILTEIIIPLKPRCTRVYSMHNSYSDYAILSVAVTKSGEGWRIAVGARPQRAACAEKAMEYLNSKPYTPGDNKIAAAMAAEELMFGSNTRGSAGYRETICENILIRLIEEAENAGYSVCE